MSVIFPSLRGYQGSWLRNDLVAGATVWAVLVPEALAYATIAGAPPVVGLYAAAPALVLYAMFGSSRHLVVGPMSATAALSAGTIATFADPSGDNYVALTAALAIVTGVVAMIAGLLRLGFLAGFISEPVLKGFIVGLALTIIMGQLPKLFGVDAASGNFFEKLWGLVTALGETHWPTFVVGFLSLALVLGLRRYLHLVPGSLVAVALGVIVVMLFDLDQKGVEVVGTITPGLPHVGLPGGVGLDQYLSLAGPAFGVVLVGFAEGLGAAKTYAARAGYDVDANKELLGLGAANAGSGLASGMVVNGSLSKTAVNGGAGAKSQVSGLFVAVLTIITLLFLTGLFEQLPEATLGAIVVAAVIELVDIKSLRRLYGVWSARLSAIYGKAARADFTAAIAAMFGVLIFDTLPGLVIGIVISFGLLLYRSSRPNIATLGRTAEGHWHDSGRFEGSVPEPGIVVLRVEGGLFFANADAIRERVVAAAAPPDVHGVVLDCESVPFVDVTAAEMIERLRTVLAGQGKQLVLARDIGQVRDVLGRAGDDVDAATVYPSVSAAVDAVRTAPPSATG
ncbi:MAG TPA: SulP family inorganic anion transporter [Lapillicoccus sp.]|nr:SulP family inorganic anion transporter [Lapillicoccus sp.]